MNRTKSEYYAHYRKVIEHLVNTSPIFRYGTQIDKSRTAYVCAAKIVYYNEYRKDLGLNAPSWYELQAFIAYVLDGKQLTVPMEIITSIDASMNAFRLGQLSPDETEKLLLKIRYFGDQEYDYLSVLPFSYCSDAMRKFMRYEAELL